MRRIEKFDKKGNPLPRPVLRLDQTWEHSCWYDKGDTVVMYGDQYICIHEHESNIFGNDLFDKLYWYHVDYSDEVTEEQQTRLNLYFETLGIDFSKFKSIKGPAW